MLFLFALFVAMSGGVVFRLGGVRISATSPGRVLAWTAAILVVRHLLVRQRPFPLSIGRALGSAIRAAGPLRDDVVQLRAAGGEATWQRPVGAFAFAVREPSRYG